MAARTAQAVMPAEPWAAIDHSRVWSTVARRRNKAGSDRNTPTSTDATPTA